MHRCNVCESTDVDLSDNFCHECEEHITITKENMKAEEIVKEIISGQFSKDEINSFYNAYKTASNLQRERDNALALSKITIGTIGKITGIKPAKWNGVEVEVTKINKKRIEVKETGKEFSWPFTIPANCLIPNV